MEELESLKKLYFPLLMVPTGTQRAEFPVAAMVVVANLVAAHGNHTAGTLLPWLELSGL